MNENWVAMLVEHYRRALMQEHADDWTMDTISEAAHICARAHARLYNEPLPALIDGTACDG